MWTRLHCTGGDVLVLLGSFWAVSLLRRSRHWFRRRDHLAAGCFVAIGLAYTAASEVYNTQVAHTWAYAPHMPRLFGIGIAPMLQWLVLPPVILILLRRGETPRSR